MTVGWSHIHTMHVCVIIACQVVLRKLSIISISEEECLMQEFWFGEGGGRVTCVFF